MKSEQNWVSNNFLDKLLQILPRLQRIIYIALYFFAIINIFLLFINLFSGQYYMIHYYTVTSACLLTLNLILKHINTKFSVVDLFLTIIDLIFISIAIFATHSDRVFQFYLLGRQTFYFIKNRSSHAYDDTFYENLMRNPPVFVLLSFATTIFIGTLLLLLPVATADGTTTIIDALFTSTSATCVTGLIVHDTGTHFSLFGQIVILLLLQIGGLGIMTISSAFAVMLGQKLTLKGETMMQDVLDGTSKVNMINLLKSIIVVTFIFELLGTLTLYLSYHAVDFKGSNTLYHALFHAISAFCNAGFSLYPDSMTQFRTHFSFNFIMTSLIIVGGIGFPVLADLYKIIKNKLSPTRLSLHSKIVITATLLLILAGFIGFFISEYNSEMNNFNIKNRIYASYFQSVTTRTAGFNTIDNSELSNGSVLISSLLMFIGASPGSTGGGVKTTALVVIMLSVFTILTNNKDVNVFRRKVSEDIIKKVMALITISISVLSFMIFLLLIIENLPFRKIIFEAFSAFGTVGLSMGITPKLSGLGKTIIIFLMYFGRVGPLTLIYAFSEKKNKVNYRYIEEKISIG